MRKFEEYSELVEGAVREMRLPVDRLPGLYEPVVYGMASGGKRLRPVLTLMACEAWCGDARRGLPQAVGIELFHNFTLLHDDVMDNSAVRRGRPSVHAKWDMNTAILSGDAMLTLATMRVADVDGSCLRDVLDCFNKMALEVYEGQQMDMDFERREDVSLEEYIEMIRLKTSVLLGAAARIGAIVGGGAAEDCRAVCEFAEALGIAFQIQDDYLDVYGDAATFGKPIGGDILNDKKTFLSISTARCGEREAGLLREARGLPRGDEKIAAVRDVYDACGVRAKCREAIEAWSQRALEALSRTSLDEERRRPFVDLAEKLINRER